MFNILFIGQCNFSLHIYLLRIFLYYLSADLLSDVITIRDLPLSEIQSQMGTRDIFEMHANIRCKCQLVPTDRL